MKLTTHRSMAAALCPSSSKEECINTPSKWTPQSHRPHPTTPNQGQGWNAYGSPYGSLCSVRPAVLRGQSGCRAGLGQKSPFRTPQSLVGWPPPGLCKATWEVESSLGEKEQH